MFRAQIDELFRPFDGYVLCRLRSVTPTRFRACLAWRGLAWRRKDTPTVVSRSMSVRSCRSARPHTNHLSSGSYTASASATHSAISVYEAFVTAGPRETADWMGGVHEVPVVHGACFIGDSVRGVKAGAQMCFIPPQVRTEHATQIHAASTFLRGDWGCSTVTASKAKEAIEQSDVLGTSNLAGMTVACASKFCV